MTRKVAGTAGVLLIALLSQTACVATPEVADDSPVAPIETTGAAWEFQASAYVLEALDFIEDNGLFVPDVDWAAARESVIEQTVNARTPEETHGPLREALDLAGGRHSALRDPWPSAGFSYILLPEADSLSGGVSVINIPAFRSPRPEHVEEYATAAREAIDSHSDDAYCGWIVDLRENYGGNVWPMLSALTPLLPDGPLMQFVDRDGNRSVVSTRDEGLYADDQRLASASGRSSDMTHLPVAILQSGETSSSAEAVVLSFMSRENVRTFGADTSGLTTGNVVKTMPDGMVLRVTSSFMASNSGEPAGGALPAQTVTGDPLSAASEWLSDTCDASSP